MAPGSYVVLSHGASDVNAEKGEQAGDEYKKGGIQLALRTREEFSRFFEGLGDRRQPGEGPGVRHLICPSRSTAACTSRWPGSRRW
ncbi:hypothetical protein SFIMM107S_04407 [Streptomyces griseus]